MAAVSLRRGLEEPSVVAPIDPLTFTVAALSVTLCIDVDNAVWTEFAIIAPIDAASLVDGTDICVRLDSIDWMPDEPESRDAMLDATPEPDDNI